MKLSKRHAELFLDAKNWVLSLVNDEIGDLQKQTAEFEEKRVKVQSEIRALENIVQQRTRENVVFQNLKPYGGKP